jgi:hypothetical protein
MRNSDKKRNLHSVKQFISYVNQTSYRGKKADHFTVYPLFNMSFYFGAGFSKAWDSSFPLSTELFNFRDSYSVDGLYQVLDNLGYSTSDTIDFAKFREIAYKISMQKKYPILRKRYFDDYNLIMVENLINWLVTKKFMDKQLINSINSEGLLSVEEPCEKQNKIVEFFRWLTDQSTGDNSGIPEGLRVHFLTTNYDFIIETILDTIMGESYIDFYYRGISPKMINGNFPETIIHNHWLVSNYLKINGGFEIYNLGEKNFEIDYRKKKLNKINERAPLLIVPNKEQDYTGHYFQTIFPIAVRTLQESNVLVIVGSSLPEEDALLRILLRQFAEENSDAIGKCIYFIDTMPIEEQIKRLENVFPYINKRPELYATFYYTGGFQNWCDEIIKNRN